MHPFGTDGPFLGSWLMDYGCDHLSLFQNSDNTTIGLYRGVSSVGNPREPNLNGDQKVAVIPKEGWTRVHNHPSFGVTMAKTFLDLLVWDGPIVEGLPPPLLPPLPSLQTGSILDLVSSLELSLLQSPAVNVVFLRCLPLLLSLPFYKEWGINHHGGRWADNVNSFSFFFLFFFFAFQLYTAQKFLSLIIS